MTDYHHISPDLKSQSHLTKDAKSVMEQLSSKLYDADALVARGKHLRARLNELAGNRLSPLLKDDLNDFQNDCQRWAHYVETLLAKLFSTSLEKEDFVACGRRVRLSDTWEYDPESSVGYIVDDLQASKTSLLKRIDTLGLYDVLGNETQAPREIEPRRDAPGKVFLIHGHDGQVMAEVARVLERQRLEVVILSEQANQGQSIVDKFEFHSEVGFAIVLFTADDSAQARKQPEIAYLRPRQNVVFELGYFWGKWGPKGRHRICLLVQPGVEILSDIKGIGYIAIDQPGAWKLALLKELKQAGLSVDANHL